MVRPSRARPGFDAIQASFQGRQFMSFLVEGVGYPIRFAALAATQAGADIFAVSGSKGQVLLVTSREIATGGAWIGRAGFRVEISDPPIVFNTELVYHRWDPHPAGREKRNPRHLDASRGWREARRRSRALGERADELRFEICPAATAPRECAGLLWATVLDLAGDCVRAPGNEPCGPGTPERPLEKEDGRWTADDETALERWRRHRGLLGGPDGGLG